MSRRLHGPAVNELLVEAIGTNSSQERIIPLINRSPDVNKIVRIFNRESGKTRERSALNESILMDNMFIFDLLISKGADINMAVNGETPLQYATKLNRTQMINKLNALNNWNKIKSIVPKTVLNTTLNDELLLAPPGYPVRSFPGGSEYHAARERFENGFGKRSGTVRSDIIYLRSL